MTIQKLIAASLLLGFFGFGLPAWAEPQGAALCVTCHDEDDLPDMSRSAHGFSADKRVPDCISCHGASLDHAHNTGGTAHRPHPTRTFSRSFDRNSENSASERAGACLACHAKDASRALWAGSPHQMADVACNSCHKNHGNADPVLNKLTQPQVCYSCHKEQRVQFGKPSHHPLPEGKMACSDCHNVHGTAGEHLMRRDSTNATCYTCHAEKRGPFVHQHDPVVEDCANCHNPHGSNVPTLLKMRDPMLCQQCHTMHSTAGIGATANTPGVVSNSFNRGQNTQNMWLGRSCLNCHTEVHGSNNPSTVNQSGQFLMR